MSTFRPMTIEQLETVFPPEIEHVSATSINMLLRCPEQWRQRYILGKKQRPDASLLMGSADHSAIAYNFEQKIASEVDLPLRDIQETYVEALDTRLRDEAEEIDWGEDIPTRARERMISQGLAGVAAYRNEVSVQLQPRRVERGFLLPKEQLDLPVDLKGYIDVVVVAAHSDEEDEWIVERKTMGRKKKTPNPDWILQGRIYQLVEKLPVEWQFTIRTQKPYIHRDPQNLVVLPAYEQATLNLIRMALAQLGFVYQRYGPDETWPTNGVAHPWACNFCGFKSDCAAWKGAPVNGD